MEKFEVNILGCGSASPTTRHFPTSQVVNMRDKLYMIDCGEGAQLQMRRSRLKFSRLNHIFISHLHGDHCFGLMGLISTFSLLGRTAELHIYSPRGLEALLRPQLDFFCAGMSYAVRFHEFDAKQSAVIFEDRTTTVTTIPLRHRIPCCGFIFSEKQGLNHLVREAIDRYEVPLYELNRIKHGDDYTTPSGEVIPNSELTIPAAPPRRYAYCSDTIYNESVIPLIEGVDLLFHEATFADSELARARETFHTTARQAATIASRAHVRRLLIGHFSARYEDELPLIEEARTVFADTMQAKENLRISL
jgi:ribonuclease Z